MNEGKDAVRKLKVSRGRLAHKNDQLSALFRTFARNVVRIPKPMETLRAWGDEVRDVVKRQADNEGMLVYLDIAQPAVAYAIGCGVESAYDEIVEDGMTDRQIDG